MDILKTVRNWAAALAETVISLVSAWYCFTDPYGWSSDSILWSTKSH
jgi:hypothetical protein